MIATIFEVVSMILMVINCRRTAVQANKTFILIKWRNLVSITTLESIYHKYWAALSLHMTGWVLLKIGGHTPLVCHSNLHWSTLE